METQHPDVLSERERNAGSFCTGREKEDLVRSLERSLDMVLAFVLYISASVASASGIAVRFGFLRPL